MLDVGIFFQAGNAACPFARGRDGLREYAGQSPICAWLAVCSATASPSRPGAWAPASSRAPGAPASRADKHSGCYTFITADNSASTELRALPPAPGRKHRVASIVNDALKKGGLKPMSEKERLRLTALTSKGG